MTLSAAHRSSHATLKGSRFASFLGLFSLVACTCKCPPPATQTQAQTAAQTPQAASGPVAPIHQVSEVPRPAVVTKSQPIPGFMRGINLGNALDAPSEGAWGVTLTEAHFDMVKAAGLDHVRLPVRFSAHAAGSAPYTIEPEFFARVDWAIQQAQSRQLSIIVDLHHYEELMKQPEQHYDRFLGLWTQIAERYKDRPANVAFELLNEPNTQLTAERWNDLAARAIKLVRQTNPTRLLIIDCFFWANADYLHTLNVPADPNIVASFHMYQPILFTHQGADWMDPEFRTRGLVFPGPPAVPVVPLQAALDKDWTANWFEGYNKLPVAENPGGPKTVFEQFQHAEKYIATKGHRMYMGEFGVIDNADDKSRENYVRLVREEAERRDIGWAYWDDGGKMKAMNVPQNSWIPYLRSALFDKSGT